MGEALGERRPCGDVLRYGNSGARFDAIEPYVDDRMAMPAGTTDGLTARRETVGRQRLALTAREERWVVAPNLSRAERVMRLVRVGEQEVSGEDQAEVDAYFAPDYAFHGPDGAEMDYEGLKGYFASLRAAFDGLSIGRGSWSSSVTTSRVRRRSQGPSLR